MRSVGLVIEGDEPMCLIDGVRSCCAAVDLVPPNAQRTKGIRIVLYEVRKVTVSVDGWLVHCKSQETRLYQLYVFDGKEPKEVGLRVVLEQCGQVMLIGLAS